METNDVLAHACLGNPFAVDILCDTWQGLYYAEMHGKPLLSPSTNPVHFPPSWCFFRRLFLMHIDLLLENV